MTRIAINGFGRIGRLVFRAAFRRKDVEIVAINDITNEKTLAHLLKYDSVHGTYGETVESAAGSLTVGGKTIKILAERDPAKLPWKDLKIDVVIESTGLFTKRPDAQKHIDAGARKVVISAPATDPDITICIGVNDQAYDRAKHHIVSNASCTTNCLAPLTKILHENFGIEHGLMTTIHSYTNDQQVLDLPHKDLRRARAAALSMIPTTTGAARAIGLVMPELKGKLDGFAVRVPTPNVSVVDLVARLKKPATVDAINDLFRKAAAGPMKNILNVTDEPLVSCDFNGDPHSSTVDTALTLVVEGHLAKVISWYDNEWGYSNRVAELAPML